MRIHNALKILHLYNHMDYDDRRVINYLYYRINGGLWVSDWRTASGHRWQGTTMAELARRLGLTNWHNVMEEMNDKYQSDLDNYHRYCVVLGVEIIT